jgi:hypothetical protein
MMYNIAAKSITVDDTPSTIAGIAAVVNLDASTLG